MSAKRVKTKKVNRSEPQKKLSSTTKDWLALANAFLEKRKLWVIAFLMILSMGLSLIYFLQARNSPIMTVYKWENSDMSFFDTWSKHIASGDWWGEKVMHPFHDWHDDLAEEYFRQFPDIASQYNYTPGDTLSVAKKALINDLYKGKTFHQEPLYTYMLAITNAIFGPGHHWIYFWQFLLAAITNLFVFLIGRHFFGAFAGLLTALFVTLCGSIVVFEMVLVRTTLTNFFTVVLLYLFIRALVYKDLRNKMLFGIGSGLALLAQTYFILFIIPAALWMIWTQRKVSGKVAQSSLAFVIAFILILSPLFIRNIKEGVSMVALASNGAITYITNNVQNSYPMESFYVHMPTLARIMHDSGGKTLPAAVESLKTFESLGKFWHIYRQKIAGLFMWYEIPNNMNYYLYREIAPILKILAVSYFFIAPLGLAGLLIGLWRHRWKLFPLVLMTIVSILPLIIAGNMARYRSPLVIMMAIFAAYFIVEIFNLFRKQKMKEAFIGLIIALAAFVFTTTSVDKNQFVYLPSDFDTFYRHFYMEHLVKYEEQGNYQEYLKWTTRMMDDLPDYFFKVKADQIIIKGNEAESCRHVANFMESHFNILTFLKMTKEAAFYKERINTLRARVNDFNRRAGMQ
jgi:4-amino-4-deoxy-L-arabinose transferase-like glycosyltransferase